MITEYDKTYAVSDSNVSAELLGMFWEHTSIGECGLGIVFNISLGEFQNVAIDFLGLARKAELLKECAKRINKGKMGEIK